MGIGDVVLRNDIQYERYDLVSAAGARARRSPEYPGSAARRGFGTPTAPDARARRTKTSTRSRRPPARHRPAPVVVYPVANPTPIVRAESTQQGRMLAGDGEGLVDAADVGLLDGAGDRRSTPAPTTTPEELRAALSDDTVLVLTDSNRRQARRWTSVRDNLGVTEQPGENPDQRRPERRAARRVPGERRRGAFDDGPTRGRVGHGDQLREHDHLHARGRRRVRVRRQRRHRVAGRSLRARHRPEDPRRPRRPHHHRPDQPRAAAARRRAIATSRRCKLRFDGKDTIDADPRRLFAHADRADVVVRLAGRSRSWRSR